MSADHTSNESPPWAHLLQGREKQLYPILTAEQIEAVRPYGTERRLAPGEVLWTVGARDHALHVVLEGRLDIVRHDPLHPDRDEILVSHGPGSFSGEMSTLSGRAALVEGRAATEALTLELSRSALQRLVATEPDISEIIMRSFILRRMRLIAEHVSGAALVGSRRSAALHRLEEFLTRNGYPYQFVDADQSPDISDLFATFQVGLSDLPLIVLDGGGLLRNPSLEEVAAAIGVSAQVDFSQTFDLAVIGAGPAGLAAAVYGASEGLSVIVLESMAPGGQAGTSSKIENYLGFPTGISGQALAGRAINQASKFGASLVTPCSVAALACGEQAHTVELQDGSKISARAIVISSGARYRKLDVADLERFEGAGVYYEATYLEGRLCKGADVVVVGGGNSAGQAAMFLSRQAAKVHILVRGQGLSATMSQYLVTRIENAPNIELLTRTEIVELSGDERLRSVTWRNVDSGETSRRDIGHAFIFIGADPCTAFAKGAVALDPAGFVLTGLEAREHAQAFPNGRHPFLLETSCPRIFAAGDVRSGSVKRVASAVGEGSMCVQFVHKALAETL